MAVILVRSNIFNERDWETEEVLTHRKCANVSKVNTCNVRTFDRLNIWTFGQPCTMLTWGVKDPKCRQCSQWWPSVVQSPTLAVIPWKMFLSLCFIETLPNVCSVVYAQPGVKWQVIISSCYSTAVVSGHHDGDTVTAGDHWAVILPKHPQLSHLHNNQGRVG